MGTNGISLPPVLFQITHCIGDSYIVADPGFVHWVDTIPLDLCQLAEYSVLINLCGLLICLSFRMIRRMSHPEDVSRWTAQLPKNLEKLSVSSLRQRKDAVSGRIITLRVGGL